MENLSDLFSANGFTSQGNHLRRLRIIFYFALCSEFFIERVENLTDSFKIVGYKPCRERRKFVG